MSESASDSSAAAPPDAQANAGSNDVDLELLELTQIVLSAAGYWTTQVIVESTPLLLAENLDNALVVAASITMAGALRAEPVASRVLIDRIGKNTGQPKLWDGYVALLTSQIQPMEATQTVFDISYNLQHLRRIVRADVDTTLAGVQRALRPVLPLQSPQINEALIDPLEALRNNLVNRGLDAERVADQISLFRASTDLSPDIKSADEEDDPE